MSVPPSSESGAVVAEIEAILETCREEDENYERCNAPAEFILWGKLLPSDALGPRCYDHAAKHVGHGALGDPAWAIFDLRRVARIRA